jgi:rare lipoprotein A
MHGIGGQTWRSDDKSIEDTGIVSSRNDRTGSVMRQVRTILMVAAAAGFVAACGSAPQEKAKFSPKKYGVKGSPKVVAAGKPVPKGGGRYVVGKKYKIAGKWYYPKHEPNYKNVGLASWYGPTFHGRKTANGEVFDRNALTAAHTTMPLPSYARVTNVNNGRSMIVRVNDRGPFHGNRIIDLSERVANMLDTKSAGVAKVKVEYVGRAPLHGQDETYLMASYNGPGASSAGHQPSGHFDCPKCSAPCGRADTSAATAALQAVCNACVSGNTGNHDCSRV